MNKILKRIKSMLINKLHRVCYESKDSPTADSFADDMKNFTEAFGHLDIHDNMIELALIWTGDGRVDDLDLAALVLNNERKISIDYDFVYFNSKYRVKTVGAIPIFFKEANIYSFSPSNKEGSVVLDGEFSLYLEEQGDGNCESVYVDLGKLDTEKVSSIVFCVCNYSKEFAFKYLESLTVCIYSGRTKKVLQKYSVPNFPKHTKEDVLCLGSLEYSRENKNWIFNPSLVLMFGWWNKVLEKYT